MKRVTIAIIAVVSLLAFSSLHALADDPPPTGPGPTGGCSGPDCK